MKTIFDLHIHFGAGQLGIGAVLPVLNPALNLIVVQQVRGSGDVDWNAIAQDGKLLCCNSNGIRVGESEPKDPYRKWFRCRRQAWKAGDLKIRDLNLGSSEPLLLVVDHISQIGPILGQANSLSCSLGGGQSSFAELLSDCRMLRHKAYILAFENTLDPKLSGLFDRTYREELESTDWPVYPAVIDRICSRREFKKEKYTLRVQCESHIKVIAPEEAAKCFNPDFIGTRKPVHLVPLKDLRFHLWKKRGLVNSLHQLLALFCFRALSERNIPTGGQYLPLVMAWFAKEHPHLHHSVELYARLRALELIWPMIHAHDEQAKLHATAAKRFYGVNDPQQLYDALLKEADQVIERFQEAADELKRLIDPENLRKELKKFDEHVLKPINFARVNEKSIAAYPLYNKPNIADLGALEDILSESFLKAMDKAMSAPPRALAHTHRFTGENWSVAV